MASTNLLRCMKVYYYLTLSLTNYFIDFWCESHHKWSQAWSNRECDHYIWDAWADECCSESHSSICHGRDWRCLIGGSEGNFSILWTSNWMTFVFTSCLNGEQLCTPFSILLSLWIHLTYIRKLIVMVFYTVCRSWNLVLTATGRYGLAVRRAANSWQGKIEKNAC